MGEDVKPRIVTFGLTVLFDTSLLVTLGDPVAHVTDLVAPVTTSLSLVSDGSSSRSAGITSSYGQVYEGWTTTAEFALSSRAGSQTFKVTYFEQGNRYHPHLDIWDVKDSASAIDANLTRLYGWPGHKGYLGAGDGKLWRVKSNVGKLMKTVVSPDDVNVSDFALSPSGRTLFVAENRKGLVGHDYDNRDKDGVPADVVDKQGTFFIRAYTEVGERESAVFTNGFVLCSTTHAIDHLCAARLSDNAVTVFASCIEDMSSSRADIYEIRVPQIACATPIGMTTESVALLPGQQANFEVTVRNDGNTLLRGMTVDLLRADTNEVVAKGLKVSFNKDTVVGGSGMVADKTFDEGGSSDLSFKSGYTASSLADKARNNPLVANNGADVVAPGATVTVKMPPFTVPGTWKGTVKVKVRTSDLNYSSMVSGVDSLSAVNESSCVALTSSAFPDAFEQFEKTAFATCMGADDAVAVPGKDEMGATLAFVNGQSSGGAGGSGGGSGSGGAGGSGGSGTGGGSGSGSKGGNGSNGAGSGKKDPKVERMPDTGENPVPAAVTAAAAVLGAGLAAYGKRRLENESSHESE